MQYIKAKNRQLFCGDTPIVLKGFGLGGWLLPEGYMWKFFTKCDRPRRIEQMILDLCGKDYAERFWPQYYSRYITEKDIRFIAGQGFNSVRLPINARHYTEHLPYIDALIQWCREYGVYVIIDMHAAPGGQTGQNIDDTENDSPELFTKEKYRKELVVLWKDIAARYADEPAVAGYGLLNEPLPDFWSQYKEALMPLYDELIAAIREIDQKHMIILEGTHWSSDFSVFDHWQPSGGEDNLLLEFHKYWNNPDKDSIQSFLDRREKMNLPLFMGEGGENNGNWYTGAFPLYERLNISWSFWSYKKMSNTNSRISFPVPDGWQKLLDYLDGGEKQSASEAIAIFDGFLNAVTDTTVNTPVINALKREAPVSIPCEFYDGFEVGKPRPEGAILNVQDTVNIQFADGHKGMPDYKRYNGEPQPESENLVVILQEKEWLEYRIHVPEDKSYWITVRTQSAAGMLELTCGDFSQLFLSCETAGRFSCRLPLKEGWYTIRLICKEGKAALDTIEISEAERLK